MSRAVFRTTSALFALVFLGLLPAIGSAQSGSPDALPSGVKFVVTVEGISQYQLDNGLEVILFPDPSQATTTVNITYRVGSLHEGYGETGMAHLLEHLLFKGSTKHTNIPDELTSHGARPNGSTWFDRTNYFETFAATDENLEWALDLESDRMVNSFVAQKDLDSEMSVVRNEFEIGENDPQAILEERVYSTAYLWHNYGNSTIGARSDIEAVPIERLQAFYHLWYRPENAVLVVAGKFDPTRTLALIQKKFGGIQNPAIAMPPVYTREPAQDGERSVTLRRVGELQAAAVAYHIPAGSHPDFPPLEVLAHVLGSSPSGRLHKSLVETGRATSVDARADRFKDPALFLLTAEVAKDKDVVAVQNELIHTAENVAGAPPTDEEVQRAVNALLRQWETTMRNTSWAAINLSEWASMGDWRLVFLNRDRLREVHPADVARVAQAYLVDSNRTTGLYLPTKEARRVEIPEVTDLPQMLASYQGGEAMAMGEDFDASPANIMARMESFTLANGMEVMLLPKKTRGETVDMDLNLHFGSLESLRGLAQVSDLTGDMLMRGTTTHTRAQIRDELDKLQATLRVRGGGSEASANLEVTRPNLTAALDLVADILRHPAFDAEEFRQLKEERLVDLEQSKTEPGAIAFTGLNRHLSPYPADDPRATLTPDEEITRVKAVEPAALSEFFQKFYGASQGQIAIAGDFDPAEVKAQLEKLFGDWNSAAPFERIVTDYDHRASLIDKIQVPDKESASMAAGLRIQLNQDDADYPAMVLGSYMLGGGFLNSRLATRIRQQEGLSYAVGARFFAPAVGNNARLTAFAMYAPQNDARLVEAFQDEMRKAVEVPFTADEVKEAKSGWLQRQQVSRSNDSELVRDLTDLSYNDLTIEWQSRLEDKVAGLTPEQIFAAMKKYIVPGDVSIVRAGDFEKAAAAEGSSGTSSSSVVD
ncbi:MAG: pitrilysin family protein [Candidatus Eisenbacteria bacterium]|uniref:Insulinase family protein n=1 Tax=Eiseniibacteriota bacterium TaxID=2212470 RepID=A0A956LZP2_UNCEI|nr:insulinase family protein [Candidatus Eisenbacteria bacterium]